VQRGKSKLKENVPRTTLIFDESEVAWMGCRGMLGGHFGRFAETLLGILIRLSHICVLNMKLRRLAEPKTTLPKN